METCIVLNHTDTTVLEKVANHLQEKYGSRIEKTSDTSITVWDDLESELMRDIICSEERLDEVCEEIGAAIGHTVSPEMFEF